MPSMRLGDLGKIERWISMWQGSQDKLFPRALVGRGCWEPPGGFLDSCSLRHAISSEFLIDQWERVILSTAHQSKPKSEAEFSHWPIYDLGVSLKWLMVRCQVLLQDPSPKRYATASASNSINRWGPAVQALPPTWSRAWTYFLSLIKDSSLDLGGVFVYVIGNQISSKRTWCATLWVVW